jgi:hypothetical protein
MNSSNKPSLLNMYSNLHPEINITKLKNALKKRNEINKKPKLLKSKIFSYLIKEKDPYEKYNTENKKILINYNTAIKNPSQLQFEYKQKKDKKNLINGLSSLSIHGSNVLLKNNNSESPLITKSNFKSEYKLSDLKELRSIILDYKKIKSIYDNGILNISNIIQQNESLRSKERKTKLENYLTKYKEIFKTCKENILEGIEKYDLLKKEINEDFNNDFKQYIPNFKPSKNDEPKSTKLYIKEYVINALPEYHEQIINIYNALHGIYYPESYNLYIIERNKIINSIIYITKDFKSTFNSSKSKYKFTKENFTNVVINDFNEKFSKTDIINLYTLKALVTNFKTLSSYIRVKIMPYNNKPTENERLLDKEVIRQYDEYIKFINECKNNLSKGIEIYKDFIDTQFKNFEEAFRNKVDVQSYKNKCNYNIYKDPLTYVGEYYEPNVMISCNNDNYTQKLYSLYKNILFYYYPHMMNKFIYKPIYKRNT